MDFNTMFGIGGAIVLIGLIVWMFEYDLREALNMKKKNK